MGAEELPRIQRKLREAERPGRSSRGTDGFGFSPATGGGPPAPATGARRVRSGRWTSPPSSPPATGPRRRGLRRRVRGGRPGRTRPPRRRDRRAPLHGRGDAPEQGRARWADFDDAGRQRRGARHRIDRLEGFPRLRRREDRRGPFGDDMLRPRSALRGVRREDLVDDEPVRRRAGAQVALGSWLSRRTLVSSDLCPASANRRAWVPRVRGRTPGLPRGGDEQRSPSSTSPAPVEAHRRGSDNRGYVNRDPVPARSPVRGWGYFLAAFFLRSAQ